jgi:agmatine deiminase
MTRFPPAEWAPQRALFVGFPSDGSLWEDDLAPAQAEVAALARQLGETVPIHLLASDANATAAAKRLVPAATAHQVPFGDIWLRDTGPVFTGPDSCVRFRFNGWGGKYDLAHDDTVGAEMAGLMSASVDEYPFILEGGAIEYDGQGLLITTEQCLLNPNRNPGWTREAAEQGLNKALGTRRIIWLGDGLLNDHTDGHVDNLARFVGGGTVALPVATDPADPNGQVFADAAARIRSAGLVVAEIPSVGPYEMDGELVPASYMNWIVANGQVVVPLYGAPNDEAAVAAVRRCFPRHRVTGSRADHILTGGGSFHCISQQVPE